MDPLAEDFVDLDDKGIDCVHAALFSAKFGVGRQDCGAGLHTLFNEVLGKDVTFTALARLRRWKL